MTLGLGAKAKPNVIHVSKNEALIAKDNNGYMVGNDGKTSRSDSIDWPAPPEEIALVKPYVFAILPPGTVPTSQIESVPGSSASTFVPSPVIEVRSSISLSPVQTIPFPPSPLTAFATSATHVIRLLSPSPSEKSPLFVVSTPTDRTAATTSGSAIWSFRIKPWNQQIDELVEAGAYSDALSLLESLDAALIADKERKQHQIRALQAVDQFRNAKYDDAINAFIELDINPAKVVALYPESISGRLAVPQDEWVPLFGGPRPPKVEQAPTPPTASSTDLTGDPTEQEDNFHRSIETLMRYLSDRRPKIAGALATFHITPLQSHEMPHLSATSKEDLLALPSARLSSLTPEELVRFAQIVDTALFKSYLLNRPGLLASLCRVGWCEVSEVEELLREREKYQEMIYLYGGRKMHGKALDLLRQLSEHEADPRDKLMPTVNYLQRLGPEHMDQIFEHSKWVFEHDRDIAFEIFTSEEAELPKEPVADFLEKLDPALCARYIEFLISERGETSQQFHDRLAELYLRMTVAAKRRGDDVARRRTYEKLLQFINTTEHYSADRLFAMLPSEDLFEAKAILLGRLGRHDSALEVYVYRLQDFLKAEEYCKRVYQPHSPTGDVFLTLLRIYLLPGPAAPPAGELLPPALELISRHSPRLDPVATLQLLPPLVTAEDVRAFLLEALRAPVFDTRVVRNLYKAREEQVARRLMVLQSKRVRITESRMWCHKRLGGSVIAVHAPHGEVTHYQCREAFSRKLKETRT
ncbi:vacuolar sorting protein 39 domain 1-domain-containing protein [Daedaleopsis nitida]|nr:vacuolar sorting protein 39 domain 1-domain-containing protein [Daedaleopsis nitida]